MNIGELEIKFRELVFIILFLISVVAGAVGIYYSNIIQQNETRVELSKINDKLCSQGNDITTINKDVTKVKIAMVKNGLIEIEDMIDVDKVSEYDYTKIKSISIELPNDTKLAQK